MFESVIFKSLAGTTLLTLSDVTCPWPAPKYRRKYGVNISQNRPGDGGPGYRNAQLSGTSAAMFDLPITCRYIDSTAITALETLAESDPPTAFQISIDSGANYYRAVFQEEYFVPEPWPEDFDRMGGTINLHILGEMP